MVIHIDPKKLKKKAKCLSCGKEFEISINSRFKRKYCESCSKSRKKDYDDLWKVKAEDCDESGGGW